MLGMTRLSDSDDGVRGWGDVDALSDEGWNESNYNYDAENGAAGG